MNIKKVFTFALAGALSISMLAGCGSSSNESTTSESKEDTSLTDVQSAGHFTLGLDADFAPMGFTDDNGEIVGFDIDLAKEECRTYLEVLENQTNMEFTYPTE